MPVNPIAVAIPLFFLLIGIEFWVARRRGLQLYRFADSIAALSCGISQQVIGIFSKVLVVLAFMGAYEHYRIMELSPSSPLTWILAIFWVDFSYYWWHRLSHRVNFMWAIHVVHHQSQELNLSVGLRQALFSNLSSIPFFIPMAIVGVPPVVAGVIIAVNTLYQFWIHTELVRTIGPFEWVLNTASHHRVHHGINPRYIDKNYAGMSIIWDRIFGTFEPETEKVVYGTVKPFTSWNAIWANFEYWVSLAQDAKRAPRLRDKFLVWFMPPEWTPEGLEPKALPAPVDARTFQKWDTPERPGLNAYVTFHFVIVAVMTTAMLFLEGRVAYGALVAPAVYIFFSLLGWGGLREARPWATTLEWSRLAFAIALSAWATLAGIAWLGAVGGALAFVSVAWFAKLSRTGLTASSSVRMA